MPEAKNFTLSHTELAAMLVKELDLHEGFWGIYIEFGFIAANVPVMNDPNMVHPAAIALINKMGIQRFDVASNLTVDAAIVNPLPSQTGKKRPPKK